MMRLFLRSVVVLVLALLLVAALGPFLIPAEPAPGAASGRSVETPVSQFQVVRTGGGEDLSIHYLATDPALGQGADRTPFLLLHGFTFNAFTWEPSIDFFAERGPTVAYDQVPYGLSDKPLASQWRGPSPYSKEAALEQLFAFMDALGMERAVLVGNSSGGTLALEAALRHPERVRALVLIAPWVYVSRPTLPQALASLPQMRRVSLLIARKLGENGPLLDLSYADPAGIDQRRRDLFGLHKAVAAWDLGWGELLQHSLSAPVLVSAHLDEIRVPVLLVAGDQDALVPVEDSLLVAERLPDAELALLPGCGHVPHEECPAAFAAVVDPWLRRQGIAQGIAPGAP